MTEERIRLGKTGEAMALFSEGAVFVDARSSLEYGEMHIEGAVLIRREDLGSDLLPIISTTDRFWEGCECNGTLKRRDPADVDCVVYGSGPDDENVAAVFGKLSQIGFRNVLVLDGGFGVWYEAGYDTKRDISPGAEAGAVVFFFMPGCQNCTWARKRIERIVGGNETDIVEKSMALRENRRQREIYDSMYGVSEEKRGIVPALFIGRVALVGKEEIRKNFSLSLIREQAAASTKLTGESTADGDLFLRFRRFSPVSVALAGLLDGVNPCAFAVLVFFLSYLAFTGRDRKNLVLIGIVFIAAIFATYLVLGFGIFTFLEILKRFQIIIGIIYSMTALVALVLAFFNIADSIRAAGGDTRGLSLQMSEKMKRATHAIIRKHASSKYVVIVAGFTGFLISLFEFGCTGQIYLPTIVYIFDMPGFNYRAMLFLVLYNSMFILPLLAILCAVVIFGKRSEAVGKKLAERIPVVKACTGGFFVFLAGYMIYVGIRTFM